MAGSIIKARKGQRPQVQGKTQSQPVTQQEGSGSVPKPMTSGTAKPASSWFK